MGRRTEQLSFSNKLLLPIIRQFENQVLAAAAPHVIIVVAVIAYVVIGTVIFVHLDEEIAGQSFYVNLLFTFTTVSTIGYGNIAPKSFGAQMFCIVYVALGIPLLFLALGNLGKFLVSGYWGLVGKFQRQNVSPTSESKEHLPFVVILLLLLTHTLLGGLLFHVTEDQLEFQTSVYFSFISFTTIGYGDFYPTPQSCKHVVVIILYLTSGMVIMSTFVSALGNHLQRIHYLGRSFKGAQDVDIWFGGQSITVADLLGLVAEKFQVSPEDLQDLLRDLDTIIEDARTHSAVPLRQRQLSCTSVEAPKSMWHKMSTVSRAESTVLLEDNETLTAHHYSKTKVLRKLRRSQSSSSSISRPSRNKRLNSHIPHKSLGNANHDALFKALEMVYHMSHQQTLLKPTHL